jgi:prevent-host-death family protein
MPISLSEDIHSVTDLKRRTREIVDQLHRTGRPVVLTVNGRADAVLLEVKTYETLLKSANLARLLAPAETEVAAGRTRPAREFFTEFKRARDL